MEADRQETERGDAAPTIALRAFEERTRALSLESQMVECVDLLQNPSLLVDEVLESVSEVREAKEASNGLRIVSSEACDRDAFFYPSRELFVQGDGGSFTCLATELDFQDGATPVLPPAPVDEGFVRQGRTIDYAAVTCESRPLPVLGFAQRSEAESGYPLLLRALSSLIELVGPRRFDLLDRDVYRGLLGPAPVFDLALVLWDDGEVPDERRPLCELTRDLAELLKRVLAKEPGFPPILHDVVCLRMNPKRFDGRLRFVWRV
jgi:hypothetical protein